MHRSDDFDAAFESFRARFSVKTLLIATTVVAVLLGIGGSGLLTGSTFAGFICVSLLGLGSAHAWLNYQENRRREELIARREAELRRARRSGGSALDDMDDDEEEETPAARMPAAPVSPMEMLAGFLRFSTMEMLGAVTVAAGMLALLTLVGSPAQAAAAMGALAITGFALQAADIDIPRPLLLAWWIALLGYCVFSLVSLAVT